MRSRTWSVLLGLAVAGCGQPTGGAERFTPPPDLARSALHSALEQWKAGEPPGTISGRGPAIQVVDMGRKNQKLDSFQILGEVPGNGPRVFAVKLALAEPRQELTDRYVVLGIDPLWVFREKDLDDLGHWEMHMDHAAETKP